jgi:dTDP-4-dehydrorhamnose reductase
MGLHAEVDWSTCGSPIWSSHPWDPEGGQSPGFGPMTRVLLLGANGMLGGMVSSLLGSNHDIEVVASTRRGGNGTLAFDAAQDSISELLDAARCSWIINAIGFLDNRIDEDDPDSLATAFDINAAFPNRLVEAAGRGRRVILVATDGVFSGQDAPYDERAPGDADGVYARSKSLGEVRSPNVVSLRCSVIGPEPPPARSLLGWALSQPAGATIPGYSNHRWNGITSLHFAKLCAGLILADDHDLPSLIHVLPDDSVSKAELLQLGLDAFGRSDVTVVPEPAPVAVDRTLATAYPEVNGRLWAAAGYPVPPTIAQMVTELALFGR